MIVAVTGPSAAGKTTWCHRHRPGFLVPEFDPGSAGPPGPAPADQAAFWASVNSHRWRQALHQEHITGLAICDDDPMKLHYPYSLARVGELSWSHFEAEVHAHRRAVAAHELGFADLFLVSIPSPAELRRRRDADPTRRRRNFDRHVRLAEPLREWYEAVQRTGAATVRWHLPTTGLPDDLPATRDSRYDLARFDAVVDTLPGRPDW